MTDRIQNGRRLNYDLQILYDYGRSQSVCKVILVFEDSEAFEGKLLAELVDVLRYVRASCKYPFCICFEEYAVGPSRMQLVRQALSTGFGFRQF